MLSHSLLVCTSLVMMALVGSGLAADKQCYECRSMCVKAVGEVASRQAENINKQTCMDVCVNIDPKKTPKKNCGNNSCFTAIGIIGRKTKSGEKFHATYFERGCIQSECPNKKVCDLLKLETCQLSQGLAKEIQERVEEGATRIESAINKNFERHDPRGQGGEMHCCDEDLCNHVKVTDVAHTYLHDEL